MKYIITENRMINLVELFIKKQEPNFLKGKANIKKQKTMSPYFRYADPETDKVFAKYHIEHRELQLNTDLFNSLEKMFGEKMTYVIDWFNQEFKQDAEVITF